MPISSLPEPFQEKSLRLELRVTGNLLSLSYNASRPDETAGWPQDHLHNNVPFLLMAMACPETGPSATAERVKAAAMQLLPPLLNGLHARWLAGSFYGAKTKAGKTSQLQPLLNTAVSTSVLLQAPACPLPSQPPVAYVADILPNA